MKKLINWFKYSPTIPYVGMWLAYAFAFFCFISLAYAGGGDYGPQQQTIEIIKHAPEKNWTDYLEWIIPGVVIPIVLFFLGWWFNKRRK